MYDVIYLPSKYGQAETVRVKALDKEQAVTTFISDVDRDKFHCILYIHNAARTLTLKGG